MARRTGKRLAAVGTAVGAIVLVMLSAAGIVSEMLGSVAVALSVVFPISSYIALTQFRVGVPMRALRRLHFQEIALLRDECEKRGDTGWGVTLATSSELERVTNERAQDLARRKLRLNMAVNGLETLKADLGSGLHQTHPIFHRADIALARRGEHGALDAIRCETKRDEYMSPFAKRLASIGKAGVLRKLAQTGQPSPELARAYRTAMTLDLGLSSAELYSFLTASRDEIEDFVYGGCGCPLYPDLEAEERERLIALLDFILMEHRTEQLAVSAPRDPLHARAIARWCASEESGTDADTGDPPEPRPPFVLLRGSIEPNAPTRTREGVTTDLFGVASLKACA